jgi:hypothetical protein
MKKKTSTRTENLADDMRPEYDFSGGVRGKYAKAIRENGCTIRVYETDSTFTEKRVAGENTITLAPDVREYFPTSQAVNRALRTLIALVPEKRRPAVKKERDIRSRRKSSAKSRLKV